MVLNPWNIDALQEFEKEYQRKVYTILQLRVHPKLIELKANLDAEAKVKKNKKEVVVTYITSRGSWYDFSWKGEIAKSGGVATNIGIHFFDLVIWLFGYVKNSEVHLSQSSKAAGFIELENANVRWFLSVDKNDLPEEIKGSGKSTFRSITIDEKEIEFTDGFTDLHTLVYQDILQGKGFGLADARASIEVAHSIRHAKVEKDKDTMHPFLKKY